MMLVRSYSLFIILLITGCTSLSESFCTQNGYAKNTQAFAQCEASIKQRREDYHYCIVERNISQKGLALEQCLKDAPSELAKLERKRQQYRQQQDWLMEQKRIQRQHHGITQIK